VREEMQAGSEAGQPVAGPPNMAGLTAKAAQDFLGNQAQASALHFFANRHLDARGRTTAWEHAVSWAKVLQPLAATDSRFHMRYGDCRRRYVLAMQEGRNPDPVIERLHVVCALEMRAQGRLGQSALPTAKHNPLTEAMK
jgi:hypothetical protein